MATKKTRPRTKAPAAKRRVAKKVAGARAAARSARKRARILFWAGGAKASRFLSNHFPAPFSIDGVAYATVEHWYQSSKAVDAGERREITEAPTPMAAKERARKVSVRADWDDVKLEVMKRGAVAKFQQNPKLADRLLATGDADLVHYSEWSDSFWAVDRRLGGLNHMGRILMQVRAGLRRAR